MSLNETMLAETLRAYLAENAPLPVGAEAFNLDLLLPDKPSMSLRMTGGEPERTYIDGSKSMRLNFTIFYRNAEAASNADKSAMLGALNAIGAWMDGVMTQEKPYLGDWLEVTQLEQVTRARLDTDDKAEENYSITYLAEYVLGYQTR